MFDSDGVTTINRFNEEPDFSPDGSQLVFEASDSDDPALWLVGSDGSDEHAVSSTWDVAYSPAFSPDGQQIVFENYGPPGPQIAVVDTDGSNFTVLAEGSSPSWGPMPATCRGRLATIVGTDGDDTLSGTSGGDVIVGLGGNDHITGRGGDDSLCGGAWERRHLGRRRLRPPLRERGQRHAERRSWPRPLRRWARHEPADRLLIQ